MAITNQQLEQSLDTRLEETRQQAEQKAEQSAEALGVKRMPGTFGIKALNIKGKAVAQKELYDSGVAMNDALTQLMNRSKLVDIGQKKQFQINTQDQLAKLQRLVLDKGNELMRSMNAQKLDYQKQQGMLSAFSNLAKGIAYAYMVRTRNPDGSVQLSEEELAQNRTPGNLQKEFQGQINAQEPNMGATDITPGFGMKMG